MTTLEGGAADRNWPCMACGYNLRGLPESGNCPECGHSIGESLRHPAFPGPDDPSIKRIRRGILLGGIALALFVIVDLGRIVLLYAQSRLRLSFYFDDIRRLAYPILLLPAALLLIRSPVGGARGRWSGRWLLPTVIIHLGIELLIILNGRPLMMAVLAVRLSGLGLLPIVIAEAAVFIIEIGLLFYTCESVATRAPGRPMVFELRWMRRIYCGLVALGIGMECATRIAYYAGIGSSAIGIGTPQLWENLIFGMQAMLSLARIPLTVYQPVQLLRLYSYLRMRWAADALV